MFDFVQWGALGLLAAFMVGTGLWLRSKLDSDQAFMQNMMQQDRKERLEQAAAWQQMTREMITTNGETVAALQAVQQAIEIHSRQSSQRDEATAAVLVKICKKIDA